MGRTPAIPARPTLRQVAELAGVSLKTASRALNGEPHVAEATAVRVQHAADRLGFRRNALARELRIGARSTTVGLIIGDVTNPIYSRIAAGAERRLRREGLQLLTASSDESQDLEQTLIADMLERRVRGLMLITSTSDHGYLEVERSRGTPVVFLDRPPSGLDTDTIVLDNTAGVRSAVRHLVQHGHRRIGLVGDLTWLPTHQARVRGFRAAMTDAGIGEWRQYLRAGAHDAATAERVVRELLALSPAPTALVTTNNRITLGALRALRSLRDDAEPPALVGFDDFEVADLLGVTVVAYDAEAMGAAGAGVVLDRIAGSTVRARREVVPTRLIARGSGERAPSGA